MVTRKATSIISSSSISSKAATMTALAMFALSSCAAVLFYHKSQTRRKKQKQPAKRQPKQKPFRKSKGGKNTTSGKRSNHSSIEHDDDDNNHHHGKENDEFSYDTDETPIKSNQFSHLPPHIQREMRKEEKRLEKLSYLAMKTPMYDNVRMLVSLLFVLLYIQSEMDGLINKWMGGSIVLYFFIVCFYYHYDKNNHNIPFISFVLLPPYFSPHFPNYFVLYCTIRIHRANFSALYPLKKQNGTLKKN